MDVLQILAGSPRDALLVHQAGHVRGNDVFGAVAELILNLVESHACGHGFVRHAERAAKPATVVGPIKGHEYQSLDLRQQRLSLVERWAHNLRRLRDSKASE